MTFHVFDTYVKVNDWHTIHFDVITDKNDSTTAISFAKKWLKSIGEDNAVVTTGECKFCHSESVPEDTEIEIMINRYFIAKMERCPKN